MKILLVYPSYPDTFWSFRYALKFISKKASFPPLGLLTVAALLPEDWQKRLLDMNVEGIRDEDILWADYVFVSAMEVQKSSAVEVIRRAKDLGRKVVAGGPLFTLSPEEFPEVDHLVFREAEEALPLLIKDMERGKTKRIYASSKWPDITASPMPAWDLLKMDEYAAMCVQYCRGCPFDCEFCDIALLNGRRPRTKTTEQVLRELDGLYERGWRGTVFFVDDNFIGKPRKLKEELLPALIEWMRQRRYPFSFLTEASVNLADDEELMRLMVRAGFDSVFVGIESPEEESLSECNKVQNQGKDLLEAVKRMQRVGLQVLGGFIVGFDSDPPTIFQKQVDFIQQSGIVTAMVGMLNAPKGTRLYERLQQQGRILGETTGDNTDFSINFIPKMGYWKLVEGYKQVVTHLYSPHAFYKRLVTFLKNYRPPKLRSYPLQFPYIKALFRSIWVLGVKEKERFYYWRTLFWTLLRRPRLFSLCVGLSIYGYHFRKVFEGYSFIKTDKAS